MTRDLDAFPHRWQVDLLPGPPLIAPARQYVFPQAVPGEEDALARGAMWLTVRSASEGSFLAQCALGFAGNGVATGLWSTPEEDDLLAIAGGYAYRIRTQQPERTELLPLRPVVAVHTAPQANAVALVGFHHALVLTAEGHWQSPRLSWEGVTELRVEGTVLHGMGWHMPSDKEIPFSLDLVSRELTGGGFSG